MLLVNPQEMREDSLRQIEHAIEEDWGMAELQPVLYARMKEEKRYDENANNAEIGASERLICLLVDSGIRTFQDLIGHSPQDLINFCKKKNQKNSYGLGPQSIDDICWAVKNFYRFEECEGEFVEAIMPNELPPRRLGHGLD